MSTTHDPDTHDHAVFSEITRRAPISVEFTVSNTGRTVRDQCLCRSQSKGDITLWFPGRYRLEMSIVHGHGHPRKICISMSHGWVHIERFQGPDRH